MRENEPARSAAGSNRQRAGRARGRENPAHRNGDRNRHKDTAGHSSVGLGYYLEQTLKTLPEAIDLEDEEEDELIASVASLSRKRNRPPTEVWPEILSKVGRCPKCGREPQPSGDGELVCPACDLALAGGCR